jgi:hypothetical protein
MRLDGAALRNTGNAASSRDERRSGRYCPSMTDQEDPARQRSMKWRGPLAGVVVGASLLALYRYLERNQSPAERHADIGGGMLVLLGMLVIAGSILMAARAAWVWFRG